jgi:hypothetical protein
MSNLPKSPFSKRVSAEQMNRTIVSSWSQKPCFPGELHRDFYRIAQRAERLWA